MNPRNLTTCGRNKGSIKYHKVRKIVTKSNHTDVYGITINREIGEIFHGLLFEQEVISGCIILRPSGGDVIDKDREAEIIVDV